MQKLLEDAKSSADQKINWNILTLRTIVQIDSPNHHHGYRHDKGHAYDDRTADLKKTEKKVPFQNKQCQEKSLTVTIWKDGDFFYSLVPNSRTITFKRKSKTPLDALWASLIRPKSESYDGGGAEMRKHCFI